MFEKFVFGLHMSRGIQFYKCVVVNCLPWHTCSHQAEGQRSIFIEQKQCLRQSLASDPGGTISTHWGNRNAMHALHVVSQCSQAHRCRVGQTFPSCEAIRCQAVT